MAVNPDYAYRDFWAEAEAGQSIRVAALAEIIPRPEELVRVCSAYKNTSTISEPREYRMVPEEARHVRRAIENQQLTGREALHAAHMVAQQYEGAIDYSGHAAYGSIAVPYVKDYNDAIVHALYNALPESLGQGSQSAIAKGGRYWFATREVVDAFVADRHTPHVVTACWSSDSRLNFRYDAIPVTTFDLPRDLFIVDAVAAGRQEVLAALREVAGRMSACQNPKRLADTLTDSSIRIMPFAGEWDTAYDQKEWASYPTLPQPLPPDDVAKNKYVRMREEDMFSAARRT
jgi:hypothetical protein